MEPRHQAPEFEAMEPVQRLEPHVHPLRCRVLGSPSRRAWRHERSHPRRLNDGARVGLVATVGGYRDCLLGGVAVCYGYSELGAISRWV